MYTRYEAFIGWPFMAGYFGRPFLLVYIVIENGLPYMRTRNEYRAKARRSAKPNDNLNK